MNEYERRLHELSGHALSENDLLEVATCARAAGVRVELRRVDLRTGEATDWFIEADGTRSEPQTAPTRKAAKRRRSRQGVQVVGGFDWEIPDEIEAEQKPQERAQTRLEYPGLSTPAAVAGAAGAELLPGMA